MSAPDQSKRILFVDDETSVLALLQAVCGRIGPDWDVAFADSGSKALQLMAERPFDVVVADMRMPGMSGADLLNEVMERYPRTGRILLSSYADQPQILRLLGATHQYLGKPCDLSVLGASVGGILALEHFLSSDRLGEVVEQIQNWPRSPALYRRLIRRLASPEANPENVAALISEDANLTARLLQLADPTFLGRAMPTESLQDLVRILGFSSVRSLVLFIYAFLSFEAEERSEASTERLWRHSLATGLLARRIAAREGGNLGVIEASFTAGLLHDVGKLILRAHLPEPYQSALDYACKRRMPQWQAEAEVIGVGHAEVGAAFLGRWGLPSTILGAVAWHHHPRMRQPWDFSPLAAVHMSDSVHARKTPASELDLPVWFDREYVDSLKLGAAMSTWEEG